MISVCMATFNGERYIKEQLDSILPQLGEFDEVVVSDDNSTDRTIEVIKSYGDERIRLFEEQSFSSPTFNFENALKQANGDQIFLSDQDDIWAPNKVEIIRDYLKDYDLVVSDAFIIDEFGNQIENSFFELNRSKQGLVRNIMRNSYLGCAMAFNRNVLEKALPFPSDCPMHDWWLGLIGECYGDVYLIESKLISYRKHGSNVSSTGERSKFSLRKKLVMRFMLVKSLIKNYFGLT